MLLIDSSVWIDFLRGAGSPETALLDAHLAGRKPVATTGIILQEVLQGAKSERDFNLLEARLSALQYLPASKRTHVEAAALLRKSRTKGVTVPTTDALIAAVAVEHMAGLLTADHAHFRALARISKLQLVIP